MASEVEDGSDVKKALATCTHLYGSPGALTKLFHTAVPLTSTIHMDLFSSASGAINAFGCRWGGVGDSDPDLEIVLSHTVGTGQLSKETLGGGGTQMKVSGSGFAGVIDFSGMSSQRKFPPSVSGWLQGIMRRLRP